MEVVSLIHKPLSDDDIRKILGSEAKIIKYSELDDLSDIDQLLPNDKDYAIILYEDRPDRGHWTALLKYDGVYEHFDSYGAKPDSQLKWVSPKMREHLGQSEPFLTKLLRKEEEKTIHNNVQYQSKDSKVNTCGSHVCSRIYRFKNDDFSLSDYHRYMSWVKERTGSSYDMIVAEFVRKWLA
jgi:hypothetical protein